MAKSDKSEKKEEAEVPAPPAAESGDKSAAESGDKPSAAPQQQRQQRVQVQIDDSKVMAAYANFCRVTGTPEELIIDFGLNPQPFGIPTEPIPVTQRIIINFFTAKRMLHALQLTIQRHEATFGVLETDVQKRVRPGVMGAPPPQPPQPPQPQPGPNP